jgi:phosphatidate cytidylyltransferase
VSEHDDRDDREERTARDVPAPPSEGVRILGAQEAAAVEAERGSDGPAVAEPIDSTSDTATSPRHWPDEGPSWSAIDDPEATSTEAPALPESSTELPHWSEPPTGQMPAVFADAVGGDDDDDLDAWATLTGSQPRYRAEGGDWGDATDLAEALGDTDDDDLHQGALAEHEPDVSDDDEAFVQAVRARRRSGTRQVVTSTPTARPAVPRPRRANAPRPGDMLPSSGRDLNVAMLSAGVFAVIALACFMIGRAATSVLAAVVIGVCALELANVLHEKGLRPATVPVVAGCAAMPIAAYHYGGLSAFPVMLTVVTISSMLWYLWQVGPGRAVIGVATSALVFAYVGGLGGYAGVLLQARDGVGLLLGTVICVIAYDVVGYFVGSQFGHSPIAPNISPNKTVEGTLSGVGASVVLAIAVLGRFEPWHDKTAAVMGAIGLLLGVSALVGDLCESMLKRDLGIKDFGSLLPGHGGFLDRFDGLLFALPVAFYLAVYLDLFRIL